jgi:hypothetical protein
VNTLRYLRQKGLLDQADVNSLVSGTLLSLEQSGLVEEPAAHAARELLSVVAESLGVPLSKPN